MQNNIKELLQLSFVNNLGGDIKAAFSGIMSQESIVGFGEVLRSELHQYHPLNIVNRVFAVYVEMSQNVLHYSMDRVHVGGRSIGKGTLLVLSHPNAYVLFTSNLVEESQKKTLQNRIESINKLNAEEIKNHYLTKRREMVESDSKGAGLGFIDIARRSENPLLVDFVPAGQGKYLFCLSSKIIID